jgi:hypothetical protein
MPRGALGAVRIRALCTRINAPVTRVSERRKNILGVATVGLRCLSTMTSLDFALSVFVVFAHAVTHPIESNSFYCCNYNAANVTSCSLGGCQRGNVSAFHIVDDCTQCTNNGTIKSSDNSTTTTCTFCGIANGAPCATTTSDAFGCAPPNASFPILYSFAATSTQLTRPLCCWFAENATTLGVVDGVDSCQSSRHQAPLVAFAEHLFDVECPPRPPCEDDCSGHGHCAVSQCVCDKSFFGDKCNVRCDSRTCVLGHCYAMRGTDQLCHCHTNVVGDRCDHCAAGFTGVDCMTVINSSTSSDSSDTAGSSQGHTTPRTVATSTTASPAASSASSMSSALPGDESSTSSNGTTTEIVRNRSRTAETLDTFSIIALSIGGVVMMTLLICTFRRCIVWMREQRSGGSGDSFMLPQQQDAADDDVYFQR